MFLGRAFVSASAAENRTDSRGRMIESDRIEQLRHDTPGCSKVLHFNNAGSALPPRCVTDAQKNYLDLESQIGGYEAVEHEAEVLQDVYKKIAKLINCTAEEVAIVQSATSAWTQVFYGLDFKEGDRVLTSLTEYCSNFVAYLQVVKRKGIKIDIIDETPEGDLSLSHLEHLISNGGGKVALIAITHIPTNSGRVYDAAAVGEVARKYGIPYLLDACQSVGQMPIDVQSIGCDWLSATSRKFLRGPRGIGFLYASKEAMKWSEPAIIDLTGAKWESTFTYSLMDTAVRYQQYERNFAAQVGLGAAVAYALALDVSWIWQRTQTLAASLRQQLGAVPGVTVHDHGKTLCGIVSFSKEGVGPHEIVESLRKQGINVSASYPASTRLDFENRKLPAGIVRASVAYYNTEDELTVLVKAVSQVIPSFVKHTASSLLLGGLFRKQQ